VGYPKSSEIACNNAALGGHLETFLWFIENGFSYNITNIYYNALENVNLQILKWCNNNNNGSDPVDTKL
jgi:hypothetical protein